MITSVISVSNSTALVNWLNKACLSVLMLLPVPGSALQACYSGPYVVQEKVNDRDYIVATPELKRRSRLCHINMLKPFLDRQPVLFSPVNDAKTVLALSSAELIDEAQVAGALSSADPSGSKATSLLSDDVGGPSDAMVHGRLKNSELLSKLDECFPHLIDSQRGDVVSLINTHLSLFSDVPTQTSAC